MLRATQKTGSIPFTQTIRRNISYVDIQQLNLTLWESDPLQRVCK